MSNTGGLRGFKGDTYEGGIRVPMCMRWPSQVPAGTVYQQPVSNLDIVPTSLAPLGINKPTTGVHFDGVDLLPFLRGERDEQRPHETLYWRRDNDYAIRHGDWKLTWNDASGPLTIMLFNLANDPAERVDLIDQYPERAQALQDLFDAWDHTLPTSELWGAPWNRNRDYPNGTRIRVVEFNADPPTQHTARKKIKASN
jgi:arylsulfatase A-like enzyme